MADKRLMFTIYAIDRKGGKHGSPHGACATLEEAMQDLHDLIADRMLDSKPDKPFFVRYGITFTDDGVLEITRRLGQSSALPSM